MRSLGGAPTAAPVLPAADAPWLVPPRPHRPRPGPPAAAGGLLQGRCWWPGSVCPMPGAHWLLRATTSGLEPMLPPGRCLPRRRGGVVGKSLQVGSWLGGWTGLWETPDTSPCTLGPHQPGDPAQPARAPARPPQAALPPGTWRPRACASAALQHAGHSRASPSAPVPRGGPGMCCWRHSSGGLMPRRWAAGSQRDRPLQPRDPSGCRNWEDPTRPPLGHRLVASGKRMTSRRHGFLLLPGGGAPHQGQDGDSPWG